MKPSWADPDGPDYQSVFDVIKMWGYEDKKDVDQRLDKLEKKRPEDEDDDERKKR